MMRFRSVLLFAAVVTSVSPVLAAADSAPLRDPMRFHPAAGEGGASGEAIGGNDHVHAEAVHGHDDAHESGHGHPELPNLIGLIMELAHLDRKAGVGWWLSTFVAPIYSWLIIGIVSALFMHGASRLRDRPGRIQVAVEWLVETFDQFICGILGREHGRRFLPFLGTLFLFIWLNNLAGMVPFFMAPTSQIQTTAALALCVFCYVQYVALTELGPKAYLYHLAGEPSGVVMWCMSPLFLLLHLIGELAKPLSLALRLFGNILGEDILLGSFMLMGAAIMAFLGLGWIGVPLHFPFFFLSLLLGTIQALVFTLLSTIYILLVLPHETHEPHGEGTHA